MNHIPLRPGGLELTKQAAARAGLASDSRVLDIGCGMGDSLGWILQTYGCFVAGVDQSGLALWKAEENLESLALPHHLVRADAAALPYPDGFFDLVMMECTLTLFEDPERALQEALRVMRPDGMLYISALTRKHAGQGAIIDAGLLIPEELERFLTDQGCQILEKEDQSQTLIQFVADIIFQYGSLEEYVRLATEETGGCVFCCDADPKQTGYACYYIKKKTPVH